ncbi:N-acetylmuramic acid 6-phosphate etherase [Cryobacterium sp. PH31-L1]|uniref:N-acetylmuramic acid 6-phosphate etherase n=1 Tax=Cryobacterium sp. PH31-L1 TaxID=3046199 RepID=UPI0024BAAC76|nr:N-acetylmuramic acid 6-phosphate etherase [Cryobacterium sp. PH31-L1]MDJ0376980.1 N-acetylmuramic acid 6-phosphate etherase [Cryobacterium sp. PH31-L1]
MHTANLPRTERRHPASMHLDRLESIDILRLLNDADAEVAAAVRVALPAMARLVDAGEVTLAHGGTIAYFGAGTSGRLAVLDAAELIPTFDLEPGRVVAHIAGGRDALLSAVEGSEDSEEQGAIAAATLGAGDVAIGVTASGTTPYVRGALRSARERGITTALVTSNPQSPLAVFADIVIVADTGPEILTGSTRLKAGTAAKFVLNGFSTAVMVRRGRAYSNLMVSLVASNVKLRHRSVRILAQALDLGLAAAADLLTESDGEVKTALVRHLGAVKVPHARELLRASDNNIREALRLAALEEPQKGTS